MKMSKLNSGRIDMKDFLFKYGFYLIILAVVVVFSMLAPHFLAFNNFNSLFHAASPMVFIASGMAFVVIHRNA